MGLLFLVSAIVLTTKYHNGAGHHTLGKVGPGAAQGMQRTAPAPQMQRPAQNPVPNPAAQMAARKASQPQSPAMRMSNKPAMRQAQPRRIGGNNNTIQQTPRTPRQNTGRAF